MSLKEKFKKTFHFMILVVILISLSLAITHKTVDAASYPSIFAQEYTQEGCIGEIVEFEYNYFPEYKNEKIIVKVYNSDDDVVATSERSMYNTSIATVPYTVTWDTDGIDAGEYRVEATLHFYTLYEWHENPTKRNSYITLREHDYEKNVAQTATFDRVGNVIYTCSNCDKSYEKTIPKVSSAKLSKTTYVYDGNSKKPTVTIKDSKGNKLKSGTDYTVKYAEGRKKVGKYKVTVTFKGNYRGKKTLSFKVNPKSTSLTSLSKGVKQFTAKWNKVSNQATGYQIMYATNSKFTKNKKTVTVKSYKTTSKKITGLKANTKYYVKVRSYKTINNTKYYSSWSKYKTVTTLSVNSPKLRANEKTLKCGETYTQKLFTSKGKVISTSKLKFSSSNKKVATVTSKGVIKAKKPGTATITVKYNGKSYKSTITVKSRLSFNKENCVFNNRNNQKVKITTDDTIWNVWSEIQDTDVVDTKWGSWNGNSVSLTIIPKKVGSTKIKITHDGKGSSYDCKYIKITVNPDWSVKCTQKFPLEVGDYLSDNMPWTEGSIDSAKISIEESGNTGIINMTFTGTLKYREKDWSHGLIFSYIIYDSDGYAVVKDLVYTDALEVGSKFKENVKVYIDNPQGDYKIKFYNSY